jgi:hypothetical protein
MVTVRSPRRATSGSLSSLRVDRELPDALLAGTDMVAVLLTSAVRVGKALQWAGMV